MGRGSTTVVFAFVLLVAACGPGNGGSGVDGGPNGSADANTPQCTPGAQEPCYDGPGGTDGVGPCHGGMRTCSAGGTWGSCENQQLPTGEICSNSVDDDCNGTVDDDNIDIDGDGWSRCDGDCCETTDECGEPTHVNPGALEVPTEAGGIPVDDNCDGQIDEVTTTAMCDTGLAIDSADGMDGARAIGLCTIADAMGNLPGVISAQYVRANGVPAGTGFQYGVLGQFGPNVPSREGSNMLVLSSGNARTPSDPNPCGSLSCDGYGAGTPPPGFPQDNPSCAGSSDIFDDIALEVRLRAPTNATGFSIDFAFYSFEYPEWVCTSFNDQFIVLVDPPPMGSVNGNIAFDSNMAPVSVNIAFFNVCSGCPLGTAELQGTGFDVWDDAGGTSWLRSQAPIEGGQEFTIRFALWDTGDQAWDSTVLLDNFKWILTGSPGVDTNPIP